MANANAGEPVESGTPEEGEAAPPPLDRKGQVNIAFWSHVVVSGSMLLLVWAWYVLENVFGVSLKLERLEPDKMRLPLLVPLIATPVVALIAFGLYKRAVGIILHGIEMTGHVASYGVNIVNGVRDVTIEYEVGGKTYKKSQSLTPASAARIIEKGEARILVHPKKPSRCRLLDV
ncbi:MAG: hypothetical protein AAB215_06230 [Planctomycetota bacterium]